LKHLAELGLIVPEEIPSDDDSVPLDFTSASNRDIGSLHSRYAVRHAHAIFQAAKTEGKIATLKRDLRFQEAQFRIRNGGQKLNVVNAMMEDDEKITKLRDRLSKVEIEHKLVESVAEGYADIRNAASREIARRGDERAATD
jgi:head-tail adaptor